ncbi:MAG: hypothetical protein IJK06_09375 [Clostridia bacterium]|nr:hypothetical protein [Clostridia bacterium]
MTTNKETIRTAMDRRLSFLDERPSCRAAVQYRIAQEEEPVMKKKVSFAFVCALALVLVTTAVLAATGVLQEWFMPMSKQASAARTADQALAEKYGITAEMQTFFSREEKELADGTVQVTYSGAGSLNDVLGTYTATLKDEEIQVTWNHDGENTSGGYEAEAWGLDQLKQMMADSEDEKSKVAYLAKAEAIAEQHGVSGDDLPSDVSDEDTEAYFEKLEADKTAAMEARKISEDEMIRIGREFIINNYALNDEQAARLELYTNSFDAAPNIWYWMINEKPCFEVEYLLYGKQFADGTSEPRVEKDGYYKVYVNVETGEVENYEYNSSLGGIG